MSEEHVLQVRYVDRVLEVWRGIPKELVNEREMCRELSEIPVVNGCASCPGEDTHFHVKQASFSFVYLGRDARKTLGE